MKGREMRNRDTQESERVGEMEKNERCVRED